MMQLHKMTVIEKNVVHFMNLRQNKKIYVKIKCVATLLIFNCTICMLLHALLL